jgi:Raf kinase inhibitor-like YbhB/YbcL family protein
MKLTSSAFTEGAMIPAKYSCDGQDISPPLAWTALPDGAKSLALICDDPDAPIGTWVHWVAFNLPSDTTGLPEGVPAEKTPKTGGVQGTNSGRRIGYGGPCPPSGTHRYFFKLYALDNSLSLASNATAKDVQAAMKGHILAEAQLMGRYKR